MKNYQSYALVSIQTNQYVYFISLLKLITFHSDVVLITRIAT